MLCYNLFTSKYTVKYQSTTQLLQTIIMNVSRKMFNDIIRTFHAALYSSHKK